MGYTSTVVMPVTRAREKKSTRWNCWARTCTCWGRPPGDPNHYIHTAEHLAKKYAEREKEHGAIWAASSDNLANMDIHCRTTGAEIWEQTDGKVDGFICATWGPAAHSPGFPWHSRNAILASPSAGCDPAGRRPVRVFAAANCATAGNHHRRRGRQPRHRQRRPGESRCLLLHQRRGGPALYIPDLLQHEGLCLGGSAGINIAGAVRLAEHLGPGHTIVTILCDYGNRYQSKLFNPVFLENKGLPVPEWLVI
ncbi:MAG: cysteine synthase A [Halioglobus sp.]